MMLCDTIFEGVESAGVFFEFVLFVMTTFSGNWFHTSPLVCLEYLGMLLFTVLIESESMSLISFDYKPGALI